jgi:hypothetical protein
LFYRSRGIVPPTRLDRRGTTPRGGGGGGEIYRTQQPGPGAAQPSVKTVPGFRPAGKVPGTER